MARPSKPWFRSSRNSWFVTINGQVHNLGADEKEANRKFHLLMAEPEAKAPVDTSAKLTVADIFEKHLEWVSKHRSAGTYKYVAYRIQLFINALGEAAHMAATALKPFHLQEWLDKHNWSANYRRGIIASITRAFNWAVRIGHLDANPIRFIEKPSATARTEVINDWPTIRDHYKEGDPFRLLLEFSMESGCRPYEARRIEDRHVQLDAHRVVFPKEEAKGKRRPRVIYLTPRAEQIIKHLMKPGLLFLNADGKPWTPFAINCRFCRLEKHLGRKVCQGLFRHTFATNKLKEFPPAVVAALMGHSGLKMLETTYGHVDQADISLKQAVGQS